MQFRAVLLFLGSVFATFARGQDTTLSLMNNRFLTFSVVIRDYQVEHTRTDFNGDDERPYHTPAIVQGMSDAFRAGWPGGRMTWLFSWRALFDESADYTQIRALVKRYHDQYGDEVTFIDGGYFPNVYNSREQINRDMRDALVRIAQFMGNGYRPASIVTGMLPAACQKYLADSLDIHVVQGQIWSQYAIDNGDDDGAISYPYYPSQEHMLKPSRAAADFIDVVNLDAWTCDFLTSHGMVNSRMGVGPIETLGALGQATGIKEMLGTMAMHFDTGFALNKFAFVTSVWEEVLNSSRYNIKNAALTEWLDSARARWPTARAVTEGEFGLAWRRHFKDNGGIDYRFRARGTGIQGSDSNQVIRWYMNRDFRLAVLREVRQNDSDAKVIDYTRYDTLAKEPIKVGVRNWSLMNVLNMKQTRPQDRPVHFNRLPDVERRKILARYPELISFVRINPNWAADGSASASSTLEQGGWSIAKANNGITSPIDPGWSSAGYRDNADHKEWIQIDLGASVAINRVVLYPRADAGNLGKGFPVDFSIAVSKDSTDWTKVVAVRTGYAKPREIPQSFEFNETQARFVRVQATKLGPNDGWYQFQINEIEVYGTTPVTAASAPVTASQAEIKVRVEPGTVFIEYSVPSNQHMLAIRIYTGSGRCIMSQAVTNRTGGFRWNRPTNAGNAVAGNGVYIVQVKTDACSRYGKFVLK